MCVPVLEPSFTTRYASTCPSNNPTTEPERRGDHTALADARRAGQDPGVSSGRLTNDGSRIVARSIKHPIVAFKGPNKPNLQLRAMRAVYDLGYRVGRALWTGDRPLTAGVHDSDSSVGLRRVVLGDDLATLLETGLVASLLVPAAEVTAELNRLCWLGDACVAARLDGLGSPPPRERPSPPPRGDRGNNKGGKDKGGKGG
jgi:hypothetical protein